MRPFGKYMVFGTQLYEIWEPTFNVESNIFFYALWVGSIFCAEIRLPGLQASNILESMSAQSETEPLKYTKIKIWPSKPDHTNFPKTSCFHFALTPLCFQPTTSSSGPSFGSLLTLLSFAVRNHTIFSPRFVETYSECFGVRKTHFC